MTMAPVAGIIIAAPMPSQARAASRIGSLPASPHTTELAMNTVAPTLKIRSFPNMSPIRPPTATNAAIASR